MNEQINVLERQDVDDKTTLGFWIYLMTDCLLFGAIFAAYIVLRGGTAAGPSGAQIFDMPAVLAETLILLTSSFTCGLALLAARVGKKQLVLAMLGATIVLGAAFLFIELREFTLLVADGHGWQTSAFLSAFFTLVGTHGVHIALGLLWAIVMVVRVSRNGLGDTTLRRLGLFSMFWHFLDVIWICIFSIVYLMGVA